MFPAMQRGITLGLALEGLSNLAAAQSPAPAMLEAIYRVRVQRSVSVPMRDGTKLSADLIHPDAEGRFPVILEYHPYRKDDVSRSGLDAHYYFAERGFVGVRLDVRGTGGSEGINTDEYVPQEQEDGYDAVEWLAQQPWSNGQVGMFGSSYSGFTAIQVAMQQPPHLKAIVPLYATDDRYSDDCHYTPGGNMRMYYDVGTYGGSMVAMNALPPLPEFAGPRWAEMWKERLDQNQPYLLSWMKHQVDGDYWAAASLRPGYERIGCPVFLIGGWHDGYCNPMLRMYLHLKAPKKLLMGPWTHMRPNVSFPGPRINYLHEVVRFFAHWLRGQDSGIMQEPPVTVYLQEYARPQRTLDTIPGDWYQAADFPVAGSQELTLYLAENGKLMQQPAPRAQRDYDEFDYLPTVGLSNGYWSAGGISFYLAEDQRTDEAFSLTFTTPALEHEVRILGWPRVILHAASSAQVATFVAKLADVAPDGRSALIVDGSLNGTRRAGLREPKAMQPGDRYELDVPMSPTGWIVKPGHRLRLAISGSDFPNLWPTPEPASHRVYHGQRYPSRVILPTVPAAKLPPPHFLPPPTLTQVVKTYAEPPAQQVLYDQIRGMVTVMNDTSGTVVLENNLGTLQRASRFRCSASTENPAQANIVGTHTYVLKREDDTIEIVAESSIRATEEAFHILINLNVTKNGQPFFHKTWMTSEPRRGL